jgi:hypothetical protein
MAVKKPFAITRTEGGWSTDCSTRWSATTEDFPVASSCGITAIWCASRRVPTSAGPVLDRRTPALKAAQKVGDCATPLTVDFAGHQITALGGRKRRMPRH